MKRKQNLTTSLITILLMIILVIYLLPLVLMVTNSFKSYGEVMLNALSLPEAFTFDNFKKVFETMDYPKAFFNTFVITLIGVSGIIVMGSMAGYKLARTKTKLSKYVFLYCIMPMMIPFQSFMITLVQVSKGMHLTNSVLGITVVYWGLGAPMAIFLYQGFAKSIPLELEEAAIIDGCNQFQLFTQIIFPLLKSVTAAVIVVNAMWVWNDFLLPLLVLGTDKKNQTLQLAAYSFMGQYKMEWQNIMGAAILIIIPALIIYLIFQKHIIKGMIAGAVKG
ncbi:MAG: transporter inner rane protein [Herbinix sp.]|nr:transporter inner rane protein [Herbinix sp.]